MAVNMPPSTTHQIDIDGMALHVRVDGNEGPWVAMAHGLASDHTMLDAAAAHLSTRYRVLRPDLRGHGMSGAPVGPYTMVRMADDLIAAFDSLGVSQAHFVGVSLGGMIGQTLALRHPERIMSLTLVDTSRRTGMEAHPMWHERIGVVEAHGMQGIADMTMQRWLTAPFREKHPDIVERIRDTILKTKPRGYVGACLAILEYDLATALPRIHCPTLVLVGELDQGSPIREAQAIANAIKGARLEVLPQAAHLSHIEQADRFHALLDEFFGHAPCGVQCDIP